MKTKKSQKLLDTKTEIADKFLGKESINGVGTALPEQIRIWYNRGNPLSDKLKNEVIAAANGFKVVFAEQPMARIQVV